MIKNVLTVIFLSLFLLNTHAKKVEKHGDLVLIKDNNNVYCQNNFFIIPLNSGRNHLFRFLEKDKKLPLLLSTWIWYHGRSPEEGVFYQAHSEALWPLESIEHKWSEDNKTLTVTLKSSNVDWLVTREVQLYADKPYVKLRYSLTAREYFPRDDLVAPLMELLKNFTMISYECKGKFSPALAIQEISGKKIPVPATIIQFFAPEYKRTLTVINNANLAVKNGFEAPTEFLCRDNKKFKRLHLSNSSLPPNFYLKKGETMDTELIFLLQDGAEPNPANQKAAVDLAEKFNFLPDSDTLKFSQTREFRTKSSQLARLLSGNKDCKLWYESPLKKVFPSMNEPASQGDAIDIFSAKNEKESFQVVIKPEKDISLEKVTFSDFVSDRNRVSGITVQKYLLEYQKKNTIPGLYGFDDQFADKLVELDSVLPLEFKANIAQPVWFTVNIPGNAEAGLYNGRIKLSFSDKKEITVPVVLKVWNFTLPPKSRYRAVGSVGWSSPASKRMEYIKKMSEYYFSGNLLPGDSKSKYALFDGKQVYLDEFIKRAVTASKEYHNNTTLLPNTFLSGCAWRPGKKVAFRNMDPQTKEFENAYRSYLQQCSELLKRNNMDKDVVLKVWDEIPVAAYPVFENAVKIIREVNPDFKIEYVGAPDEKLVKLADIICPGAFSSWWGEKAKAIINKYHKAGKEFWVYLNNLTFTVDQEAAVTRAVPWICWTRGISGYYQWGMDASWKSDFDQNGNVWLFYPSEGTPVPSVRLEYFRDGIEDYNYFELLKEKGDKTQLLKEIFEISPEFGPLDADIVKMHKLRLRIGDALNNKE